MLFSQNLDGPLSVTATHTPLKSEIVPIENVHLDASETQYKNEIPVKKARTKLVKNKNSGEVVAEPPTQVPRKNQIDGKKKKKKERPKISQTSQNTSSSSSVASIVSGIGMRRIIPPRRSTLDFRTSNEMKKTVRDQKEIWTEIVCTSCSTQDVNLIKQLIKKFTAAKTYPQLKLAKNISNKTTHVVCGEPNKRTLNVLRGILRGCWILTKDWLEASSEAGRWEDEEDYEMITFSSAVKACRREREAFGLDFYRCDLFRDCGSIYVSRQCKAPAKELSELIRLAGGKPVNVARVADIVVGVGDVDTADMCVGEKWILDSIQRMKVMDLQEYAIH